MLRLYNSLTRSKKLFQPIKAGHATIYSCGPTVYDHVHLGNLRAFIVDDVLQKTLRHIEHLAVKWVMNITDIDDKMIARMHQAGGHTKQDLHQLADTYTQVFLDDIARVGIGSQDIAIMPRATEHIAQMQELIKQLLRDDIAYVSEGSIYFSLQAYQQAGHTYGQLVDIDYSPQSRVIDDQDQKEGAGDFVLWKAHKDNEPSWSFEWLGQDYPGRPGWHIECSVMSTEYLGKVFDIHTGGVDLKFPHHENEIAQCGGVQAHYYVHNEFLNISGEKMSKSLGNVTVLSDMSDPLAFRLAVLQSHYRSQMELNADILQSAQERLNSLRAYVDQMRLAWPDQLPKVDESKASKQFVDEFITALEDDLNTPAALAAFSHIEGKVYSEQTLKAILTADEVLSLGLNTQQELSSEQKALVSDYDQTRKNKAYSESDSLREQLRTKHGLQVSDTQYGTLVHFLPTT